jgi:hypothetical protein
MARSTFLPLALLAALSAAGCTNLSAVRDFAATSAELTDYKVVTNRYVTSAERQLAEVPPSDAFKGTRQALEAFKATANNDKASLMKLHAATTGYMAALAGLAAKDAYTLSPEIDQVTGAIAESERLNINADHVKAYGNIAKRVASWATAAKQARDVRRMVETYGSDMDKLLEAMQIATAAYGVAFRDETNNTAGFDRARAAAWQFKLPGDSEVTPERREVVATLLRRSTTAERAAQADATKRQEMAAAGLAKVREKHAQLMENVDRLKAKEVQVLLRQAAADLKAVRKNLAQL